MDCHMPGMDGFDVALALRGKVPVIAITADLTAECREKCLSVGMNSFVPKPIDPAYLQQVLAQYFPLPKRRPRGDLGQLDDQTFHEAAKAFLVMAPSRIETLQNAIRQKDTVTLKEIWPLYWVIIGYCMSKGIGPDHLGTFLNLTLLKGYFLEYRFAGLAQSWSLTVEETFYFVAPWIFLFLQTKPRKVLKHFSSRYFFLALVGSFSGK
jgi:hypothetical protein